VASADVGNREVDAPPTRDTNEVVPMTLPDIVSSEQWRAARVELLAEEKAMTKARDALSSRRRMLPMVRVEKDYRFTGPSGPVGLLDLFSGHPQLIIQHFMFDPSWDDGCPSCTAASDEISDGLLAHLAARGTSLAVVSRAPLDKLQRYQQKRGWSFSWYSSHGSDFNYDFHVSLDPAVAPVEFNYRRAPELEAHGLGWALEGPTEQPGYSAFLTVDGEVFHTYSTFGRGTEWLGGSYAFLDLTALGRQEDWEEPKGRADSVRSAVPDFST
jgi:predicted dithiol-disulfide oxidoreductase (DUF899 family)